MFLLNCKQEFKLIFCRCFLNSDKDLEFTTLSGKQFHVFTTLNEKKLNLLFKYLLHAFGYSFLECPLVCDFTKSKKSSKSSSTKP